MRALVLKSNDFPVAGAVRLVEMYVAHLDRSRVTAIPVHVSTAERPPTILATSPRTAELEHQVLPWHGIRRGRQAAAALRQLVKTTRADIITSNDMRCDFLCRLAGGSRGLGIPWTAFVHGWTGWKHGFSGGQFRLGEVKYSLYEKFDHWAVRGADEVWAGSQGCADIVRKVVRGRVPIRVLMNACEPYYLQTSDAEAKAVRDRLRLPPDTLLVGTLGRMSIAKGHALLAKAVVQSGVPNVVAVLLGFGEEEANLRQMAQTPPYVGRVIVPGAKASLEEMPHYLKALDFFCFPSLQESLPVAVLEAMYLDNAVAASATGDLPIVLEHGKTGLLFPPGDVAAMAECIRTLALDRALRDRLRVRAKERVVRDFCAPRYSKEVENAWIDVVRQRSSRGDRAPAPAGEATTSAART